MNYIGWIIYDTKQKGMEYLLLVYTFYFDV